MIIIHDKADKMLAHMTAVLKVKKTLNKKVKERNRIFFWQYLSTVNFYLT